MCVGEYTNYPEELMLFNSLFRFYAYICVKNHISYGYVYELETQILLAGDLDLIAKGEWGTLKKDIAEVERMLKALIKSLENKALNP